MTTDIFDTPGYIQFQREATLSHIAKFASDAGATPYESLNMTLSADRMIREFTSSHLKKYGVLISTAAMEEYSVQMLRIFERVVTDPDMTIVSRSIPKSIDPDIKPDEVAIHTTGFSPDNKPYFNRNKSHKGGKRHGQKHNKQPYHR